MDLELINSKPSNSEAGFPQGMVAQLHEIIYCVDCSGKLVYINHFGNKTTGISYDTSCPTSIFDINPGLSAERWLITKKAAKDHGQWKITHQQLRRGTKMMLVEISISYCNQENIDYFYCLARPIHKLNQSEKTLDLIAQATANYTGELFFRYLIKYMAQILCVRIAFITQCLDQPPSRVRMLAYWSDDKFQNNLEYDLVGTPCDIVINQKKDVLVESELGKTFPKEKGFAESYYGIPIYDNNHSTVLGHIAFLDDVLMSSSGLEYTVFEILASRASVELQRLRTESALKLSEDKYRLLVDNQTDLIMRLNVNASLNFASPSCQNKLDKSESELFGSNYHQYIHPNEIKVVKAAWEKSLVPPYLVNFEARIRTKQGWCWFAWTLKGVTDTTNALTEVIAVGRDISQRKQAEDQMHNTLKQLSHVSRLSSMGEMATGIAHEINQPLTAILSFAQASLRMYEQENPDIEAQKTTLERIAVNAELAGEIIKRIRTFSRKGEPSKNSVNLPIIIEEAIGLIGSELHTNDINVSIQLEKNLPLVFADAIQIQQVLLNLIRNAIEAILENCQTNREIIVKVNCNEFDEFVTIQILDSGPGIPHAIRDQLFTAFLTTKTDGLGIGLSICHTIIEAHGGQLTYLTMPDDSAFKTAFQFTIPI